MDVREGLRRSRQVLGVAADPKLRGLLGEGDLGHASPSATSAALSRLDWVAVGGGLDAALLRRTMVVLEETLSDRAILRFDRMREMPADEGRRQQLSVDVVRIVFERLAARGGVTEEVLNAALAMLVEDVAIVRRDAVDAGVLERTADGRRYALRGGEPHEAGSRDRRT